MIRLRHDGDDRGIVRLVRRELAPLSSWMDPRDGRLRSEVDRRLRRGRTYVVSDGVKAEPVAFLHLEVKEQVLFIDLLAVDSARQNRRLGTALMVRAEQYGLRRGCTVSRLYVDQENGRGIRFYDKLGYRIVGQIDALKCFALEKPLAAAW